MDRVSLCAHVRFPVDVHRAERAPLGRDRQWNDLICEASAMPAHGRRPMSSLSAFECFSRRVLPDNWHSQRTRRGCQWAHAGGNTHFI